MLLKTLLILLVLVVALVYFETEAALVVAAITLVFGGMVVSGIMWRRLLKLDPSHCLNCAYDLRGSPTDACPECGTEIAARHGLVVESGGEHSFEHVILCLVDAFGYSLIDARNHAIKIHEKGESVVWVGALKEIESQQADIAATGLKTRIERVLFTQSPGLVQPEHDIFLI